MMAPRHRPPVRPVLSRDEAMGIAKRVMSLSTTDGSMVRIDHRVTGMTRVNRVGAYKSLDRESIELTLGMAETGSAASVIINQLDDKTLQQVVAYLDGLLKATPKPATNAFKGVNDNADQPQLPVKLWYDSTVAAIASERAAPLEGIMREINKTDLLSAVSIGTVAHACCIMYRMGEAAYGELTDSEVTVTCWTPDGKSSGWGGSAARDWSRIDPMAVTQQAIELANRSRTIHVVEPGRRTAILGPAAVGALLANMGQSFSVEAVDDGGSPLAKPNGRYPIGDYVLDKRLSLRSDPNDPDGGYFPFFYEEFIRNGFPQAAVDWIVDGRLQELAYSYQGAAIYGKKNPAAVPRSLRLTGKPPHKTIQEMIASCQDGIYVNRLTNVELTDYRSGMLGGLTHDGCFLIRKGKIDRAVKNFRFSAGPFYVLNALEAVGVSERTTLGATPQKLHWPNPPIIAPPVMVRDFNFSGLADAV
jgi:predicted Zn-dependent protease